MSGEAIQNSFLLYIDTQRSKNTDSNGYNIQIPTNQSGLSCRDGEFIRLTLVNFSMFRNYPTINSNNNRVVNRTTSAAFGGAQQTTTTSIPQKNYAKLYDIALELGKAMAADLAVSTAVALTPDVVNISEGGVILASVKPETTTSMEGTSNNVMEFIIEFNAAHTITANVAQCYVSQGDSFALLGGNRVRDDANLVMQSFTMDFSVANQVKITGLYPMQLYTNDYVYLRCDCQNTNMETPSFNAQNTDAPPGRVVSSRILARIPSYNEFNYYVSNAIREYFLNIQQRSVPYITLYLTDANGNDLPLGGIGNADGTQTTLGNGSFSCVIRADIVSDGSQRQLDAQSRHPATIPPRMSGPLTNLQFGRDGFNENN
jgi:hypothetical protein